MPDIGDFIRRSRRSAYKITKCDAGFNEKIHPLRTASSTIKQYIYIVSELDSTSEKLPEIRSDDGLTLETSALESLYGGQITL